MDPSETYDVAILGSGLASATLAAILARHGLSVLMLEAGSHPRFAIGESVVPEFGALAETLAGRFDVPELRWLSNFQRVRHHVSGNCGIKRNFTFLHHRDGAEPAKTDWCQFQTMTHPIGPDSHLYRPDVDAWLTALAVRYGVTYRERSAVRDPDADVELAEDHVALRVGERTCRARFLVDGSGYNSVLARKRALRVADPDFHTNSRTLFTHMVGVGTVADARPEGAAIPVPSPPDQGTLHHIFEGGWFWIIPFSNHDLAVNPVCSVGLTLDRKLHPDDDRDPEEEFFAFVERFPVVRRQLAGARAVRSWVKTRRLQYQSTGMVGDRWCLLPHSTAFLDPLYSGGLVFALLGVAHVAAALIERKETDDPCPPALKAYEEHIGANLRQFDKLVHGSYVAFRSPDLFNAWFRFWAVGNYHGSASRIAMNMRPAAGDDAALRAELLQPPYRRTQGSDDPRVAALVDEGYEVLAAVDRGEREPEAAVGELFEILGRGRDWIPPQFHIDRPEPRTLASFTVFPLLAIQAWGKWRAPVDMRPIYYSVGPLFFWELTKSMFTEGWRGLCAFLRVFRAAHFSRGRG